MVNKPNINYIVRNNLCTGCGICQDVCPQTAINFEVKHGLNTPIIQSETCINKKGCSHCYDVCPGKGLKLNKLSNELFGTKQSFHDYYIGYYLSCYSGYSLDSNIRFHSASGGLVSQFLIYLLDKEIINGAVVTGFDINDLMKPLPFIAMTKQEIINARSSKYCPVSLNGIASQLKEKDGKFIVVGLPCHIQGFRNLEKRDKKLKSKIFGYFAIYCSSTRNFNAQEFISKKYKIDKKNLRYFSYRDDGCLGYLKAEHSDGRIIKVCFRNYYHSMRSFFKPIRCLTCIDHYGDLADVCFGDIQVGEFKNDDIGINSLIVRNSEFDTLIKKANEEGVLKIDKISKDILNSSQKNMLKYKRKVSNIFMKYDKLIGNKVPVYDMRLISGANFKEIISALITYFQLYIGRHKKLWFIISLFQRKLYR